MIPLDETMSTLQLQTKNRDIAANVGKLRKSGQMPVELYGNKIANLHLSVSQTEFQKLLRKAGESTIVELLTEDGKKHNVLIHHVQLHYLTNLPIHADLLEVSMTKKLIASVALEYSGESKAVRELGGVLVKLLNEVEVECLPADLPHNIIVDLTKLVTLSDNLHVRDLAIPAKVTLLTPIDELIVKVQPPRNVEVDLSAPIVEDVTKVEGVVKEEPKEDADSKEDKK